MLGLILTTQAAVKHLGEGGSIINIGSVVSRITPPGSSAYNGTKGAVDAITGVLSRELGAKKIRVNALNPGMVETEGTHSAGFIGSEFETGTIAQTPLGRIGQGGDIASIRSSLLRTTPHGLPASKFWRAAVSANPHLKRNSSNSTALM